MRGFGRHGSEPLCGGRRLCRWLPMGFVEFPFEPRTDAAFAVVSFRP